MDFKGYGMEYGHGNPDPLAHAVGPAPSTMRREAQGGRFLVLQHIVCEPPAAYEDELVSRGMTVERVELDEGERAPDWRTFDGIISMGGPMGVADEAKLPWLRDERLLLGEAARAGVPVWGVCLGAQVLAAGLGARVYPGDAPEVGLLPVRSTAHAARDPVFRVAPAEFVTLQWHGDSFDLPDGARLLARSPAYAQQAFVWKRAYGLQFHLEVSPELAEEWAEVPAYADALDRMLGEGAAEGLVAEVAQNVAATGSLARRLFGGWLDEVVLDPART